MKTKCPRKIQLLQSQLGYSGFFNIEILSYRHTLNQGGWSPTLERELFTRGEAVVVLLYDLKQQCVILVEQCRAGAVKRALQDNQSEQAWLIEPVAGMIDPGESAEQACAREAAEEAGVQISQLEYVCQFYPSPGGSDEILHLYAASVDSLTVPEFAGLAEEGEDIRLIKWSFSQVAKSVKQAEINVASTWIALQWFIYQSGYFKTES